MATKPRTRVRPDTITEAPYDPVAREVMIWQGKLWFKKPIVEDGEKIENIILIGQNEGGVEVLSVKSNKDAVKALYDFHQSHEAFKTGDTFTRAGKVIARVDGVQILAVE